MFPGQSSSSYRLSNTAPLLLPAPQSTISTRPAPPWPRQFDTQWQPLEDGPSYPVTATTRVVSIRQRHFTIEDVREITLRVHSSDRRRSNDWESWRVCFRGRALPPSDARLCGPGVNLMILGTGGGPPVVLAATVVGIRHTAATSIYISFDLTVESPQALVTVLHEPPPTKWELQLVERGKRLLSTFATTMTARGAPVGSSGPRKYKNERAFRLAFGAGIADVCRDLLAQGVTVWALEDEVTKSAVAQKMDISRPTLDGYLKDHPGMDVKEAARKVIAPLLKATVPPPQNGHPNSFLHAPGRTRANHVASD